MINKLKAATFLRGKGLDAFLPRDVAVIRSGEVEMLEGQVDLKTGAIVKPLDGTAGQGFRRCASVMDAIEMCPTDGDWIVQLEVQGHSYSESIFPGVLNTLRVLAGRLGEGDSPFVIAVIHRFGSSASFPVDAFGRGGLTVSVSGADGVLGQGVRLGDPKTRHSRHPDSGSVICGVRIPFFAETCEIALEAMRKLPTAIHVGWDVAVGADGPVIVEGNASWPNLTMMQVHGPLAASGPARQFYRKYGFL